MKLLSDDCFGYFDTLLTLNLGNDEIKSLSHFLSPTHIACHFNNSMVILWFTIGTPSNDA